jgi:hypothetical protein
MIINEVPAELNEKSKGLKLSTILHFFSNIFEDLLPVTVNYVSLVLILKNSAFIIFIEMSLLARALVLESEEPG